jgi:hypothetical protein
VKLLINKLKLQKELDRQGIYLIASYVLIVLAQLYDGLSLTTVFSKLFTIAVLSCYFIVFRRLLKGLYYTFWTSMTLIVLWLVYSLFTTPILSFSFLFYTVALFLLCLESKDLWTPIYYPIMSWWEYDFRYRNDLKVKAIVDGQSIEGRLTDLRKGAGCVSLFKEMNVGEYLHIELKDGKSFKVEIMSKRYYSLGRPLSYGVRFELLEENERVEFKVFSKYWRNSRKQKRKEKFSPA